MTAREISVALLLLLGACGPASAPAPTNTATPTEHGYIARVLALPAGQREGVLFRAIQSSGGQGCQGIKQVEALPKTASGQPAWRVACIEGSQWRVALADDGTAFVTGAQR